MKRKTAFMICLALAVACCIVAALLPWDPEAPAPTLPPAAPTATAELAPAATPEPTPEPTPTPTPEPTPEPTPAPWEAQTVAGEDYDFSQIVPETAAVEDGYFADALFVGDSRTDGFRMFGGLAEGDYIVKTGLSVFKAAGETVTVDGTKMAMDKALARREYGKVYVCLGLNELGMRNDQGYYDHYAGFLDMIRAAQPQATLYIQLIIPVNAQKCAEKKLASYIENGQIAVYNDLLRQLAQEKQVFLVDPAQAIVDETGEPPYDVVADGAHFKKEPYQWWADYLRRHTIEKGEWE